MERILPFVHLVSHVGENTSHSHSSQVNLVTSFTGFGHQNKHSSPELPQCNRDKMEDLQAYLRNYIHLKNYMNTCNSFKIINARKELQKILKTRHFHKVRFGKSQQFYCFSHIDGFPWNLVKYGTHENQVIGTPFSSIAQWE